MKNQIDLKEIYLIEWFSSVEYFDELRNRWRKMVEHVENCLGRFMRNLPQDYRRRPLPEQPDVVWGGIVLPNFRSTLASLDEGYILLSHNEPKGLRYAAGPSSAFKGQMEYWSGWMAQEEDSIYHALLDSCAEMARNIVLTEGAYWCMLRKQPLAKSLELPKEVKRRRYKINTQVSVPTAGRIPTTGIYLPDIENAGAQFLSTYYHDAPKAKALIEIRDVFLPSGEKYHEEFIHEERQCTWYLVERDADSDSVDEIPKVSTEPIWRMRGGEVCPTSGFYITPARIGSRKFIQKGQVAPVCDSEFGETIWQWDVENA